MDNAVRGLVSRPRDHRADSGCAHIRTARHSPMWIARHSWRGAIDRHKLPSLSRASHLRELQWSAELWQVVYPPTHRPSIRTEKSRAGDTLSGLCQISAPKMNRFTTELFT